MAAYGQWELADNRDDRQTGGSSLLVCINLHPHLHVCNIKKHS